MGADLTDWPSTNEVAVQLGISEADVNRLVRDKKLKKRTRRGGGANVSVIDPVSIHRYRESCALARIPAAFPVPAHGDLFRSLETAFLEFLQGPRQTQISLAPQGVPVDRRIFLTLAEATDLSGLPARMLRQLISDGTLKSIRTGGGWRIPRTELEALAEKLMQPPVVREELTEAQLRDLEMNRRRRQGLPL